MKCIRCQTDSKLSERTGGTCPKCNGKFAFEPTAGDPFTDPAFAAAIDRVSAHDGVRFTAENLYFELVRAQRRSNNTRGIATFFALLFLFVGGIISGSTSSAIPVLIALGVDVGLFVVFFRPPPVPALSLTAFEPLLARWVSAHGTPSKLVQRAAPAKAHAHKKPMPKELATYSFDRAVICDRPETVDLLLANNFHFENNCAILSVTRYPEAIFEPVLEMLRRNPRIEVYALHDASVAGHDLARRLAFSPEWFRGIGKVTDVGVLVKHATKLRGLWQHSNSSRDVAFPDLTSQENAWLAQYSLPLAAIRPEQIIKRLFRAMTQPGTQVEAEDGAIFFVGGSMGGSDAGTSDGGGDSFG